MAIIEKEALRLPDGQRALLADRLIESLSGVTPALRQAWLAEADSRMEALRRGEIQAVDGPEAMSALRARFRQ